MFYVCIFWGPQGTTKANTTDKPNIIVIMLDDMGYSDIGCFGSEIKTPNLDQLAADGLRFTRFLNTSRCCPSRATVMTGLYPHQAGVGYMDSDWGHPAYQGHLKRSCVTIAEVLRQQGFRTIMSGKWHLGTGKGNNPWDRGFDRFYGIPQGGGVYFWPPHYNRTVNVFNKDDGRGLIETQPDERFYSTDAFTDYAVEQIVKADKDNTPFYMYIAYVAPHFPQQAWEKDIRKYLGHYRQGWHVLRQKRYQRQLAMGIIKPDCELSDPISVRWDSLTEKQKNYLDRQMAVYAGQVDNLDQNMGKLMRALKQTGQEENTLVMFFSDNGAPKNADLGFEKNKDALFGTRESNGGYAIGWAKLSNTPFRSYKACSHFGGTASPFIARWPEVIKDRGDIRDQFCHIIDIVPTCLDAAGMDVSELTYGEKSQPLEGISLIPFFKKQIAPQPRNLYWEHKGNRGIMESEWKLVSFHNCSWELYNLKTDLTEKHDLSGKNPELVKELKEKYRGWASQCGVLPWPVKRK